MLSLGAVHLPLSHTYLLSRAAHLSVITESRDNQPALGGKQVQRGSPSGKADSRCAREYTAQHTRVCPAVTRARSPLCGHSSRGAGITLRRPSLLQSLSLLPSCPAFEAGFPQLGGNFVPRHISQRLGTFLVFMTWELPPARPRPGIL